MWKETLLTFSLHIELEDLLREAVALLKWGKPIYWAMLMDVSNPQPFIDSNHRKEEMQSISISLNSIDLLFSPLNSIMQSCFRAVFT